jgi:hypothetical protein
MLQATGDLRLQNEPLAAGWIVGVGVEDLLQRHLAVQLGVQRDEDGPQAALGMGPQHPEPLAVAGGRAHRVGGGTVRVSLLLGRARADLSERGVDLRVTELSQALAGGRADAEGGQAPLGVAAVAPEVLEDQSLHQGQAVGRQGALLGQDRGHGSVSGLGPGMEGSHELSLVDQPGLERQQAEEEVARGVGVGHVMGLLDVGPGRGHSVPDEESRRSGRDPHRLDYRRTDHPMQPGRGRLAQVS